MERSKAIALGVGKMAAVTFALAATGYLVVNAQRRANVPASASAPADTQAPPAAVAEPAAEPAPAAEPHAAVAPVSEPVVESNAAAADPTFLYSSKVAVFTEVSESLLPVAVETEPAPEAPPVYLAGSKSMRLDVKRVTPPPPPVPAKP